MSDYIVITHNIVLPHNLLYTTSRHMYYQVDAGSAAMYKLQGNYGVLELEEFKKNNEWLHHKFV